MPNATQEHSINERIRRMAWWSLWLLLLSLGVPFVAMGFLGLHDRLDSPGPGLDFIPRTVNYAFAAFLMFGTIQLASIGLGMWVARHCRQILWRLVPQMAIVCSLSGVISSFFITNWLIEEIGLLPGTAAYEAAAVIACVLISGSLLATGLWTRWVLTQRDSIGSMIR